MINQIDIEELKYFIESYSNFNSTETKIKTNIEYILRYWIQNKEKFFKMFNNQLTLSKEIEISNNKEKEIEELMQNHPFFDELINHWIKNNLNIKLFPFDSKSLISNKLFLQEKLQIDSISFPSGMKTIRALSKLSNLWNLNHFSDFSLKHSQILNTKKQTGILKLSINPVDFILSSDNSTNWTSCMSLMRNGEYRAGITEMMNSPCIVTAYLDSTERISGYLPTRLQRQFFILTPEIILSIRAFPHANEAFTLEALNWLRELATASGFGTYSDTITTVDNGSRHECGTYFSFYTNCMYNDVRKGHYAYLSTSGLPDAYELNLSGPNVCLSCGEQFEPSATEDLLCDYCNDVIYCDDCGERIHGTPYLLDDATYCEECYDNHLTYCDECGSATDYLYTVMVYDEDDRPVGEYNYGCCKDCASTIAPHCKNNVYYIYEYEIAREDRSLFYFYGE